MRTEEATSESLGLWHCSEKVWVSPMAPTKSSSLESPVSGSKGSVTISMFFQCWEEPAGGGLVDSKMQQLEFVVHCSLL